MKRNKSPRCILGKNDLKEFILDKEAFAAFGLSEREGLTLKAHIINGFTFKHIGAMQGGVSGTMADKVYLRALKKIRKRFLEMLKSRGNQPAAKTSTGKIYIADDGVAWYTPDPSNQSPLAVGWRKAG